MSHHHRHHSDPHKRQKNLGWLGLVILMVIFVFLGVAFLASHPVRLNPQPETPPVVVSEPAPSPDDPVPVQVDPVGPTQVITAPRHRRHVPARVHHCRKHHHQGGKVTVRVHPSKDCKVPTIPGYDRQGNVVAIPNPDCR